MIEQDWIILRLIDEIDRKAGLSDDSTKAILYLIQKYGRKKVGKCDELLKKEKKQKMKQFDKLFKEYLQALEDAK
jgi:hypothetical protein